MSATRGETREHLTRPDHYCSARDLAVKPLRPTAQPYGRLGLTAKARPSKRGHHAVNADIGPLGKEESRNLAKNLLTREASYKCSIFIGRGAPLANLRQSTLQPPSRRRSCAVACDVACPPPGRVAARPRLTVPVNLAIIWPECLSPSFSPPKPSKTSGG
jgi:hypothetical protein